MTRQKSTYFTSAGSLALALGLSLRLWMHGNAVDVISRFLLGVSIALLIGGLARRLEINTVRWTIRSFNSAH